MADKPKRGLLSNERSGLLGRVVRAFTGGDDKAAPKKAAPPADDWDDEFDEEEEKTIIGFDTFEDELEMAAPMLDKKRKK